MVTERTKLTPKQLAARWQCKPDKVRALINTGQLSAIDISLSPGTGRPRFLIDLADVITFEERRKVRVSAPSRRRRRPQRSGVIEFF